MSRLPAEYINPSIRALPSFPAHQVDAALHRLQWNENPNDFPADLKEEVLQRLSNTQWSRYPLGFRAYDLINALAQFYGVSPEMVVAGNGSSDLLRIVISAVLAPGDHMVTLSPTFQSYRRQAQLLGAVPHEVALDPEQGFALPVDQIVAEANRVEAKLVVVCAPNNPTGTIYAMEDLRRIADESNALMVIDEAYAEFSQQDLRPLLSAHENIVLVRTMSKAFALAGARVGYALATPAIAGELQKLVTTFTLSPFSEAVAIVALQHADRFRNLVDQIVDERERLAAALSQLPGVQAFPSGTNFILLRLDRPAGDVHKELVCRYKLLVTELGGYPGYENYLRISVGSPADNQLAVQAFAGCLAVQSEG